MNGVHIWVERIVFWHVADALANFHALVSDIITKHRAFTGGRLNQSQNGLEKSGFSRPVLTQQTGGTSGDVDVEVIKGDMGAVSLGERRGLDDWFIRHGPLHR